VNDGFKPASRAVTRSKAAIRKKVGVSVLGMHSSLSIPQTEFPDLAIIDKFMNDALAHPHIPIFELQRVAKEVCGIPPLEVTQELFLVEGRGQQEEGSSGNLQMVVYRSVQS
jgi:hypothetical protein